MEEEEWLVTTTTGQLNIGKEVHENEDAIILPLSWLNNIQERGRITYLHVHPWRTKNLFSISEGKPHPEAESLGLPE